MYKNLIALFFSISINLSVFSQSINENKEGFFFGISLGALIPNDESANYYSADPSKTNSIENLMRMPHEGYSDLYDYFANEIIKDDFIISEYPTNNMNYKITYALGGVLGYNINSRWGLFGDISFSRLSAEGAFVITTSSPTNLSEDNTQLGTITAKESRLNIDLGLKINLKPIGKTCPYLEPAFNLNIVEVLEHDMQLASITRSLMLYKDPYLNEEAGGTGIGISLGGGLLFNLNKKFYANLGGKFLYQQTVLENTKFNPNGCIYLRLLM